jgi:hypothetical protein
MGTTMVATEANRQYQIHLEDAPLTSAVALGDILGRTFLVQPQRMTVGIYGVTGPSVSFQGRKVKKDGTVGQIGVDIVRSTYKAVPLPDWAQVIVEQVQKLHFEMLTMYTTAGEQ